LPNEHVLYAFIAAVSVVEAGLAGRLLWRWCRNRGHRSAADDGGSSSGGGGDDDDGDKESDDGRESQGRVDQTGETRRRR
jgi:hypothetical protein